MTHVVAALMSFRMVALLPHHLPRLIGFTAANRVDMDDFQQRAAFSPAGQIGNFTARAIQSGSQQFSSGVKSLSRGPAGYISGPAGTAGEAGGENGGMDSTLRATSGSPPEEGSEDV
jgi:hypothetical protein